MKRLGATLSALLLATAAAQAADLNWNSGTSSIYTPTPASDWSGFYAGVNGGYGWGKVTRDPVGPGGDSTEDGNGWQVGGTVGYNMDSGSGFIFGAEADLQWSSIGYDEDLPGIGSFEANTDFYGTLRGRAGANLGQVMPYVTAGLAAGRGTASITDSADVTTSKSMNHLGWTAGVGFEAKVTDTISLKAEYMYVDLGEQTYDGLPVGDQEIAQRFSVVRAGLNYRF